MDNLKSQRRRNENSESSSDSPTQRSIGSRALESRSNSTNSDSSNHSQKLALERLSISANSRQNSMEKNNLAKGMQCTRPHEILRRNVSGLCNYAYLPRSLEVRRKCEPNLTPRCPHLKCLLHRLIKLFDQIDPSSSVLHSALCDSSDGEFRKITSYFVIEKLLQAGADLRKVDDFGIFLFVKMFFSCRI
jgi:hypothetical protein